jgi:CheY-like chemotaxis protein
MSGQKEASMTTETAVEAASPDVTAQRSGLVPFESRHLLVVDDNTEVRGMLVAALREAGAQVLETGNPAEAIEHVERQDVDALVVDLIMPDVHGLDLLRAVRSMEKGADLPVLVLCALPDGRTHDRARSDVEAVPHAAFLDKPVTARQLRGELESLLADS